MKKAKKQTKKAKKPILIWSEIWDDFNAWYESRPTEVCQACCTIKRHEPDWEEQKCQIEEIVEKRLRG